MFRNIDWMIEQNMSFAIYRLPNQSEPVLLVGKNSQTYNKLEELGNAIGFVIAPFSVQKDFPIVCIRPSQIISGVVAINQYLANITNSISKIEQEQTEIKGELLEDFEAYKVAYRHFTDVLHTQRFDKLVLSRAADFALDNKISPVALFTKALEVYTNSFVYLCHTPETGAWLGSTPELLLEGNSGTWQTVALAGTREVGTIASNDVLPWDNKNKEEQKLVADYIKKILDDLNLSYSESETHTIRAGKVEHLKTCFTFEMDRNSDDYLGVLLEKLHPTPAVCGLPKHEAQEFIMNNEGYERGYYSGFVGYIDQSIANLYVNLRCMSLQQKYLRLYAGGGLLPSSGLMDEWNETTYKLQTMLSLLN